MSGSLQVRDPGVHQCLCDVAIVSPFCQPVLESVAVKLCDVVRFVDILEVEIFRDVIFREKRLHFSISAAVECGIELMQRFLAVCNSPETRLSEEFQDGLEKLSSDTEVFNVFIFAAVAATEDEEVVVQISGPPR